MKHHLLSALALALAASGLAACASDYSYGYGYGDRYAYYDGYYDDYYGPVSYGYWGPDDYFYYSTVVGGPVIRDDAQHFRRTDFEGARRFHMRGRMMTADNRRYHRDHDWKG
jgi:hypothetical protein